MAVEDKPQERQPSNRWYGSSTLCRRPKCSTATSRYAARNGTTAGRNWGSWATTAFSSRSSGAFVAGCDHGDYDYDDTTIVYPTVYDDTTLSDPTSYDNASTASEHPLAGEADGEVYVHKTSCLEASSKWQFLRCFTAVRQKK